MMPRWIASLFPCPSQVSRRQRRASRADFRPRLESLEDRTLPSATLPVSVDPTGTTMGNAPSSTAPGSINVNGQYEVFTSSATNLVNGVTINGGSDVYRRDLAFGTTSLVSINSTGTGDVGGGAFADDPVVTSNGRYVAFVSDATDLTSNGSGGEEVFVRDMQLGQTYLVSLGTDGKPANAPVQTPSISREQQRPIGRRLPEQRHQLDQRRHQ